jgi:signal transduction histidine kinase
MDAVGVLAGPAPARAARRVHPLVLACAGAAAAAMAAAITYAGAAGQPGPVALGRALIVGLPIGAGLYARYRQPDDRFGLVLVAAGVGWLATTLAESQDEALYTLGRFAGWLMEAGLVYVILSFPAGRLTGRADRVITGAMALVVALFYLPQLLVAEDFSVPSPYTSCLESCPGNALFALEREPAFVDAIMRPAGAVLVFAVMLAMVVHLYRRRRVSTPLTRRMLAPVVAVAMARAAALGGLIVARDLDGSVPEVSAWLLALAVPALAVAFIAGLLRWRLFAEQVLQRLAECLRSVPDVLTLREAFAEAFADPTMEIVFPEEGDDGRWMDCRGSPVSLPEPGGGRTVSTVSRHGEVVAAIVHDEGLAARPGLIRAGVSMAAVVLENQRLVAEAEGSMRELQRSRARIAAGAGEERRRIERDLHDGAQQRLVALRIELELAEELVRQDPERAAARLRELERDVDETLEELRALAHGVYPPVLADRGLEEGLRAVAARSAIRVALVSHELRRYSADVEGAVYFCIVEALQNAQKHAKGARRVVITLDGWPGHELRFSVRDDGAGAAVIEEGAGITNMRDRLAAIGGAVGIASKPGVGTIVRGHAPGGADQPPAATRP